MKKENTSEILDALHLRTLEFITEEVEKEFGEIDGLVAMAVLMKAARYIAAGANQVDLLYSMMSAPSAYATDIKLRDDIYAEKEAE